MEHGKILFVINRKSGSDHSDELESGIRKTAMDSGIKDELLFLSGDGDKKKIKDKIDSFKPGIVVAAGGDGTVNLVASVISGLNIKLGIIPLGSANGLAFEFGIPEKPEDALKLIFDGTAKPLDIIRINNNHISLHLSDVGINARIVKEFQKEDKRGFMSYVKHFFKEMLKPPRTFACSVRTDEKVFTHKAHMVIIANASNYRTGANINPGGKTDDGKFEVVIIRPYSRWKWRTFIGAFTGTFDKKPHIKVYECTSAVINVNPAQDFQIDGEPLGKYEEIKATIEKHALSLIYLP